MKSFALTKAIGREREERILVRAFETWQFDMAAHLYGMFAFALWDEEEKQLFCLRDQFGTKPFYYYETEDGQLLYGTTIPGNHGAARVCQRIE